MKRVLIANRGEIALRVIRACKDHGLESVAVYSEEDRDALHSQSADFAYSLNGTLAKDTYLNIQKIIQTYQTCCNRILHIADDSAAER
jgi:acetyl-CoA/propionyl-CoA carboxylase biotin carboxyl carrier protein